MANKQSKRKLTSKQAAIISAVIGIVFFIFCVVMTLVNPREDITSIEEKLFMWLLIFTISIFFIPGVFYNLIFKGLNLRLEESIKNAEIEVMPHLSSTDFTEVYFLCKDDEVEAIAMMRQILSKEECKFYAKLNEDGNIYLIAKDKHGEEVYNIIIENILYFTSNFTFEK